MHVRTWEYNRRMVRRGVRVLAESMQMRVGSTAWLCWGRQWNDRCYFTMV